MLWHSRRRCGYRLRAVVSSSNLVSRERSDAASLSLRRLCNARSSECRLFRPSSRRHQYVSSRGSGYCDERSGGLQALAARQAGQSLRLRRLRRARQAKSNFKPMRCPNGYSYSITSRDLTGRLLSTYPTMPNTFSCDFGLLKRSASSKVTTGQKVRRASSQRALSAATISARQASSRLNGWSYSCGTQE